MKTINQLIKNTKKDVSSFPLQNFSVLGDFSTQFLSKAIKGYAYEYGYNLNVFEADYDQIDMQIFNSESELYSKKSDFVLIAESHLKLQHKFYKLNTVQRENFAEDFINRVLNLYKNITDVAKPKAVLFFNIVEEDDDLFGNYANKVESSFLYQVRKLNFLIHTLVQIYCLA